MSIVLLVASLLALALLYDNHKKQSLTHIQLVKTLERAENDFNYGLLHLSLSKAPNKPWEEQLGITLLRQALSSYENVASSVSPRVDTIELKENIESLFVVEDLAKNQQVDEYLLLRQKIYQIRKQTKTLQYELASSLEIQNSKLAFWFTFLLVVSGILLLGLLISLFLTDRKRFLADRHLLLSEQRFLKLLRYSDDIFWLEYSYSNNVLYCSHAMQDLLLAKKMAKNENLNEFFSKIIHPEDLSIWINARESAKRSAQDLELRVLAVDGSYRWLSGRVFSMWESGSESMTEKENFIAVILRDVTEKKELDNQRFQSMKMESLGRLTGGVAHDFNNLLTVISSNIELIQKQLFSGSISQDEIQRINNLVLKATTRGARLNHQLLTFASKQALRAKTVNVTELLQESVELLRTTLGENIELLVEPYSTDVVAHIDPSLFQNALVNMCLNSKDAISEKGRVRLTLRYLETSGVEQTAKDYIELLVEDNGKGIPENLIDKVFEPFFTTKGDGEGTGLGLSMVFGFVRQSKGDIKITSKLDEGTTVAMTLPTSIQ